MEQERQQFIDKLLQESQKRFGFYFYLTDYVDYSIKELRNKTRSENIEYQQRRVSILENIIQEYNQSHELQKFLPDYDQKYEELLININACMPRITVTDTLVPYKVFKLSLNLVAYFINSFRYEIHINYVKHIENLFVQLISTNIQTCEEQFSDIQQINAEEDINIEKDKSEIQELFTSMNVLYEKFLEKIQLIKNKKKETVKYKKEVDFIYGQMKKRKISKHDINFPKTLIKLRDSYFINYEEYFIEMKKLITSFLDLLENFNSKYQKVLKETMVFKKID